MKKSYALMILMSLVLTLPLQSQGLLNKVKKAVTKEISGIAGNKESDVAPEPSCACNDAKVIIDLARFNLDYSEISFNTASDGSILVKDKLNQKYYLVKEGVTEGPYNENDPRIGGFGVSDNSGDDEKKQDGWLNMYPGIISKSGEKYVIKFGGKTYGPYAMINDFAVSRSKDKFAAIVTENMAVTESEGKKMEEAMKNAKTDQERMDLAMQMSQQMQNKMMAGGGPQSMQPKMVSNVQGAVYDPVNEAMSRLDGKVKYDEVMLVAPNKIFDLKGNVVLTLSQNIYTIQGLYLNSSNSRYAIYNSGTLTFSDNTTMSDLFGLYFTKSDNKVVLTYMYYSPAKNSIMQCAIPF